MICVIRYFRCIFLYNFILFHNLNSFLIKALIIKEEISSTRFNKKHNSLNVYGVKSLTNRKLRSANMSLVLGLISSSSCRLIGLH